MGKSAGEKTLTTLQSTATPRRHLSLRCWLQVLLHHHLRRHQHIVHIHMQNLLVRTVITATEQILTTSKNTPILQGLYPCVGTEVSVETQHLVIVQGTGTLEKKKKKFV